MPNKEKKREKPKGWRALANGGYEHQFFNIKKLDELEEKENNWNSYLDEKEIAEANKADNQDEEVELPPAPPEFTAKDQ